MERIRIGIEHEYAVQRGDDQIDFRTIIHDLTIPGRRLDPADSHAYQLRSGALLTCDGAEAEVATAPIAVLPSFVGNVCRLAGQAATVLRRVVTDELELVGVSTHISVEVPDEVATRAAGLFARTFAPALMLLMDGRDSPGLIVRPRYGRRGTRR